MTCERISLDHVELSQLDPPYTGRLHRAWNTFKRWRERELARQALARFDARMLEDIGITETEAWRETRLPFWMS